MTCPHGGQESGCFECQPATCGRGCHRTCGLTCCFRPAVGHRGFLAVCAVHKRDPRKFRPDGSFTGSVWVNVQPPKEKP
jgi:hypothetical protein